MKKAILFIFLVLPYAIIYPQDQDFNKSIMIGVYAKGGWNMPVRLTTKYITEQTSPWHNPFSGRRYCLEQSDDPWILLVWQL